MAIHLLGRIWMYELILRRSNIRINIILKCFTFFFHELHYTHSKSQKREIKLYKGKNRQKNRTKLIQPTRGRHSHIAEKLSNQRLRMFASNFTAVICLFDKKKYSDSFM